MWIKSSPTISNDTIAARAVAKKHGVEMPITQQVYLTLYEGRDPRAAVLELMSRSLRDEQDTAT